MYRNSKKLAPVQQRYLFRRILKKKSKSTQSKFHSNHIEICRKLQNIVKFNSFFEEDTTSDEGTSSIRQQFVEDNIPKFQSERTQPQAKIQLQFLVIQFLKDSIPRFESERIQPQAPQTIRYIDCSETNVAIMPQITGECNSVVEAVSIVLIIIVESTRLV